MRRYKGVEGLGEGTCRIDGSQDELISWDGADPSADLSLCEDVDELGWDIPTRFAILKTGEYVVGSRIVSREEYVEELNLRIARAEKHVERLREMLK